MGLGDELAGTILNHLRASRDGPSLKARTRIYIIVYI